ncbi:hypothetical protein ABKV77_22035, partial (plasmid) [Enterobacter hormaechei]
MPAFEWVHVQLHQQKGMISLSPPTICNSAGAFGFGGKGNSFNADTVAEVWANLMDKGSRVFRNNKTVNSQT